MHTDRNGDGKHNWADGYMDYRLSCGNDFSGGGKVKVSYRISMWALVGLALGILSGEIPPCMLSVIALFILAIVIWFRIIS